MPSMTLTCRICNQPMQQVPTSKPPGEAAHHACRLLQHGGAGAYKRGCRCEVCKTGQNTRMREYNAKKRQESGKTPQPCTLCGKAIACYTVSARPFHKACKNKAPQWMKDGTPEPAPRTPKPKREPAPPRDMRSDLRAGYEDGDYPRFLRGLTARTQTTDAGCLEWQGQIKRGYPALVMGKRYMQVHRMVIEAKEGAPLGVLSAHHICANPKCVNPDHLQPITQRENMAEMLARNSLEARIEELEAALIAVSPNHPALNRISHKLAPLEVAA